MSYRPDQEPIITLRELLTAGAFCSLALLGIYALGQETFNGIGAVGLVGVGMLVIGSGLGAIVKHRSKTIH